MSSKAGGEGRSETRTFWFCSTSKKTQFKITVTFVITQITTYSLSHGLLHLSKRNLCLFLFFVVLNNADKGGQDREL